MMKAVLLSVKPRFVADILNGKKIIEVRKRFPLNYRGWVYIYCTKDKSNKLHKNRNGWFANEMNVIFVNGNPVYDNYNGKVVARFYVDNVEEMVNPCFPKGTFATRTMLYEELLKQSCLVEKELDKYINKGNHGYAIHISQLKIFDRPRELCEFKAKKIYWCNKCPYQYGVCLPKCEELKSLTCSPQSWQFIEVE